MLCWSPGGRRYLGLLREGQALRFLWRGTRIAAQHRIILQIRRWARLEAEAAESESGSAADVAAASEESVETIIDSESEERKAQGQRQDTAGF